MPQSFFDAAAKNEALQITFFSIIFAVALSQVQGPAKTFMLSFCESLTEVMFKFVGIVMKLAPIGIGAAIAATVGRSGLGVLRNLGTLVLTLYGSLVVFALFVLLPIALTFRVPIRRFWRATKEPWLVAFSTASSEAALPLALRNMERLGVPRRIVSFVLPAGYTFNMDGTTLYLAMASVFVAQAAGIPLPLAQQMLMMLTLMLTSKGLAAVPRASLVVLSGTLAQFGLPLQGVAVILGVDALDGHGAHVAQRRRELPRDGADGAVGRFVRTLARRCTRRASGAPGTPAGGSRHQRSARECWPLGSPRAWRV